MEISKTTRFNTCKKLAQLQRVIAVFSIQIQDRNFTKVSLGKNVDAEFDKMRETYKEKMDNDILSKIPNTEEIEEREKEAINKKIENFKSILDSKNNEIKAKAENIIQETNKILEELSQLSNMIIPQTKARVEESNKMFDETQEKLKEKVTELNKVYKEEVKHLTTEAEAKERQYVVDSRANFDKMRSDHVVLMDNLRNEKPMPKLTEKGKEKLMKQKSRMTKVVDSINELLSEARYLKNANKLFIQQSRSKFNDIMKVSALNKPKVDEADLEKLRKDVDEQSKRFLEEFNEQKTKLDGLKAELDYKYQKIKVEVSELLRKMQEEFLQKKKQKSDLLGQNSAEIEAIKEQNKKELLELKERFEREEADLSLKEKENRKVFDDAKKSAKSEKLKIKKELKKLQTQNTQEKTKLEEEKNAILNETKEKYAKEEKALKEQLLALSKGGNQQENTQRSELEKLKAEKEAALRQREEKTMRYERETDEIISSLSKRNKIELEIETSANESEFETKSKLCENEVNKSQNEKRKIENDIRDSHQIKYDEEMKKIRDLFKNDYENDESINELKNEYEMLKNEFSGIKTPSNSNGEFIQLNETIKNLSNQIENTNAKNSKEKTDLLSMFERLINEEDNRHKEAMYGSSGRGRDQVKQSFRNKINDVINSRNEQEKELKQKLEMLEAERKSERQKYETEMENLKDTKYIDSLKDNKEAEERRQSNLEEEENQKTKEMIEEINKKIESCKTITQNHRETNARNIEIENESFKKSYDDILQKLEALQGSRKTNENDYALKLAKSAESQILANEREILQLQQQITDVENKIKRAIPNYEMFISDKIKRCSSDLRKAEAEQNEELHKLNCNKKGLFDYYDEAIQVLNEELDKLKKEFDVTAPRQCDLDEIAELESKFNSVTSYLKTLLKDFMNVKSLLASREAEYNHRFGCCPNIGTMKVGKQRLK